MLPTLWPDAATHIEPYFAMVVVGFAVATWLAVRWAKRSGLDKEVIIDLCLYSLILGIVGGRVLHVLADGYFWDYVHLCTDPSQVTWQISRAQCTEWEGVWDATVGVCHPGGSDCFAWAKFWNGGLAYYGGLIFASLFGVRFLKQEGFPVLKGCDVIGMVLPVAIFFGRIGCYLGGCCFGQPTEHSLGVQFPGGSAASQTQFREGLLSSANLPSLHVHPTQLYEAGGCLAIAALLMFALHPRKQFDGQVFVGFLALYAVLRFILEFFRADDRGALFGLSTSQWIGVVILGICAFAYKRLQEHADTREEGGEKI